ncbi:hypothetical protein O1611_g376 [Lasiodiplodia mahajangana]|uniref:Uncharacterized protein n=1 Tax=Lasiodiplodia mahajangana TaxID=1108764 RepID=A0ACC2K0C3_9PEZI|nr:hypothetical protein O1611_g376 [Lasiodiplodia mahajangana]
MSGGGGFYKFRCKYFFTHECPNWIYVNGTACAQCVSRGRDADPETHQFAQSPLPPGDYVDRFRSTEGRPFIVRRIDQSHSGSLAREWHIEGMVNGFSVDILADSGSNTNGMSEDEANRIGAVVSPDTAGQAIRLPSGETCLSLGIAVVEFKFKGEEETYELRCNIVKTLEWAMIVCYGFLETTETLTRFFAERIREIAPSCLYRLPLSLMMEDNTVSDGKGARMEGFVNGIRTTLVPDTASAIMAISTSCANRYSLEIDTTQRKEVTFVDGSTALTCGVSKATWAFLNPAELPTCLVDNRFRQAAAPDEAINPLFVIEETDDDGEGTNKKPWDYIWQYDWHVIDGLPVDAVLNLDFIKYHDVFNKHQYSFIHPSVRSTVPEIFGICEIPGGVKGLTNLAEQFLDDLISPDPFSHDMMVRESARQSQIQSKILELPDDIQSVQRDMEERRISFWKDIKELKDRGEDWKLRRDEYLTNLRLQLAQMSSLQSPGGHGAASSDQDKGKKKRFWHRLSRNGDSGATCSTA